MKVNVSYRTIDEPISLISANNSRYAVINQFKKQIMVGTRGSGWEQGIKHSNNFLNNNSAWIRSGAYLIIIYVSDEEDRSSGTVDSYLASFRAKKSDSDLLKVFSIVNNDDRCRVNSSCGGSTYGGRYISLANSSGGAVESIVSSFDQALNSFGENIRRLTDSFFLSQKPTDRSSITIFVNGFKETGNTWIYDENSNSVRFSSRAATPLPGSVVKVTYKIPR